MAYNIGASSGNLILLSNQTVSAVSAVEFKSVITTAFDDFVIIVEALTVSGTGVNIACQFSTDNGSTYISTANYVRNNLLVSSSGTTINQNTGQASYFVTRFISSGATDQSGFKINLYNITSGSAHPVCTSFFSNTSNIESLGWTCGTYLGAIAVNALKLFVTSGTLSGNFKLYGVEK